MAGDAFRHARALLKERAKKKPEPARPYVLACPSCGAPRDSEHDLVCRSCGGRTTE